jgi:hypothetical protein
MTEPANSEASPLKDVQNILGFLIAGFAGILSFIGLRSGEVSAVLRNPETEQPASVIVMFCFLPPSQLYSLWRLGAAGECKRSGRFQ